jgi:hypothetical protein
VTSRTFGGKLLPLVRASCSVGGPTFSASLTPVHGFVAGEDRAGVRDSFERGEIRTLHAPHPSESECVAVLRLLVWRQLDHVCQAPAR